MSKDDSMTRKKLANDVKAVISDTEELLKATAGQTGDKIESIRERAGKTFDAFKDTIENFEQDEVEKIKDAAKATDQYVRENPWLSIGIAAGAGLIIGWLIRRK
jgi:ElaB/YqjD/DUF883 family membrane-anchored ribosome-binding protein